MGKWVPAFKLDCELGQMFSNCDDLALQKLPGCLFKFTGRAELD